MDSYENLDDETMELWKILAGDEQAEVRRAMIGAIEANFPELPFEYKSIFLEKAKDKDFAIIEWVIWFISNKYDELHNAFKDDLHKHLRGFAKHPDASVRKWVAETLGENLDSLDDECRGLLKGLIEDRSPLVRDVACGFFGK